MKVSLICIALLAIVGLVSSEIDKRSNFRKSNAISVISEGTSHYVFARGVDNLIYFNSFFDGAWNDWTAIDSTVFIGTPSAVSWGPGRIDVFAIDADNNLRHTFCDVVSCNSSWAIIGGPFLPTVIAESDSYGAIDVFVIDYIQKPWIYSFSNGVWSSKIELGGRDTFVVSGLAAISMADGRNDVFCIGGNVRIFHLSKQTRQGTAYWGNWVADVSSFPVVYGTPAVTSLGADRFDLFAFTTEGNVYHMWKPSITARWNAETLDGKFISELSVKTWGGERVDYFGLGLDNSLVWRHWNGASWDINRSLGGKFISAPTASTGGSKLLSVFAIDVEGTISWSSFNSDTSSWAPFAKVGSQKFAA